MTSPETTYDTPDGVPPAKPVPALKGRFALYITPDKGLVLSYRPDGKDKDNQMVVPGFVLSMAASAAPGGTVEDLLAKITEAGQ